VSEIEGVERRRGDVSSRGQETTEISASSFTLSWDTLSSSIFIPERWLPACSRDPVYLSRSINIGLSLGGNFWPGLLSLRDAATASRLKRTRWKSRLTVKSAVAKINARRRVPFAISFLLQNVGRNYICLVDGAPLDSGAIIFMEVIGSTD